MFHPDNDSVLSRHLNYDRSGFRYVSWIFINDNESELWQYRNRIVTHRYTELNICSSNRISVSPPGPWTCKLPKETPKSQSSEGRIPKATDEPRPIKIKVSFTPHKLSPSKSHQVLHALCSHGRVCQSQKVCAAFCRTRRLVQWNPRDLCQTRNILECVQYFCRKFESAVGKLGLRHWPKWTEGRSHKKERHITGLFRAHIAQPFHRTHRNLTHNLVEPFTLSEKKAKRASITF